MDSSYLLNQLHPSLKQSLRGKHQSDSDPFQLLGAQYNAMIRFPHVCAQPPAAPVGWVADRVQDAPTRWDFCFCNTSGNLGLSQGRTDRVCTSQIGY